MSDYRIFGSEMSPYSVKVRSYFRYKGDPARLGPARARRRGRVPALRQAADRADGRDARRRGPAGFLRRSSRRWRRSSREPSIHPADPTLNFLSALIEEFGDEWGNKLMFHHRWYRRTPVDAERIAQQMVGAQGTPPWPGPRGRRRAHDRPRPLRGLHRHAQLTIGLVLELLDLLEAHLPARPYVLGGRPAFGDFGLSGQLYESGRSDAGAIMRAASPRCWTGASG